MIIAQISDTHIALNAPDSDRRIADLAATIADINTLVPRPDAIVHTGDVAHSGLPQEYEIAAAALAKAGCPVHVLAGNRDERANLLAAFGPQSLSGPRSRFVQYAVRDYPVKLIALDTLSSAGSNGDFCGERLEHLREMLVADPEKPIAVFAHHPPFDLPAGPLAFDSRDAAARICHALQECGRVAGLFAGHLHRSTSGTVGAIPAFTVPSIATALRGGSYPAALRSRPIYLLLRFDPQGAVTIDRRIVGLPDHSLVAIPPSRQSWLSIYAREG